MTIQDPSTKGFSVWIDKIEIMRRTLNPLDSDTDDDNASDGLEFEGNSFPLNVDTDRDGIQDQVEIGSTLDLDPTDLDTDGDELPDGWIDGWLYHPEEGRYIINEPLKDGFRQPWEGEDLDLNGNVKPGDFHTDSNRESNS